MAISAPDHNPVIEAILDQSEPKIAHDDVLPAGSAPAPRMPELPLNLDERQQALYAKIKSGPRGVVRGPLALLLHSPDVAEHAQALGATVRYNSAFPPKLSEFIILMVARHNDCDYEWTAHAPIAERAGISPQVIEALSQRRVPQFQDEEQAQIYDYVTGLLQAHTVSDAVFTRFHARYGERGVVDIAAIMGYYTMLAFLLNSVGIRTPQNKS